MHQECAGLTLLASCFCIESALASYNWLQVFRLCIENSIEEKVIEKAYKKLRLDALVIQQGRLTDNSANKVCNKTKESPQATQAFPLKRHRPPPHFRKHTLPPSFKKHRSLPSPQHTGLTPQGTQTFPPPPIVVAAVLATAMLGNRAPPAKVFCRLQPSQHLVCRPPLGSLA